MGEDFNKAANLPSDFKIHKETLEKMHETYVMPNTIPMPSEDSKKFTLKNGVYYTNGMPLANGQSHFDKLDIASVFKWAYAQLEPLAKDFTKDSYAIKELNTYFPAGIAYDSQNNAKGEAHLNNVLDLSQNLGIGGAVQTGHKYALAMGYDADVQFDGDGQHNVEYIAGLLEELENGADLAIGSRFLEPTDGFQSTVARRIGIRWLSWLIKLVTGKRISDPTSGLRASGPRALALFARDYPIDYPEPESIVTALSRGLTVREVPAVMNERATGSSSIKALSAVYYMAKVSLAILVVGLLQRKK